MQKGRKKKLILDKKLIEIGEMNPKLVVLDEKNKPYKVHIQSCPFVKTSIANCSRPNLQARIRLTYSQKKKHIQTQKHYTHTLFYGFHFVFITSFCCFFDHHSGHIQERRPSRTNGWTSKYVSH